MKESISIAGKVVICIVPLDVSSIDNLLIASLSGASTIFTKSIYSTPTRL